MPIRELTSEGSNLVMLFALAWGLLLLVGLFVVPQFLGRKMAEKRPSLVLISLISIALLVRVLPNAILPMGAGYDIESYALVADSVLAGQDVYTNPDAMNRHPYLPLQMYWMAFARWLSQVGHVSFVKVVRLAPILADVGIAALLYAYAKVTSSPRQAIQSGFLYALNPVSVFVSAYHGQFDAVPLLFLVLAVVSSHVSTPLSSVWLGFGVLSKSWPVLGLPSLWWHLRSWKERVVGPLVMVAIPVTAVGVYGLVFGGSAFTVFSKAVGYNWGVGVWGYGYLLRMLGMGIPRMGWLFTAVCEYGRFVTLGVLALVWLVFARKQALVQSVLTVFVTFFAVTHAFSVQYLVWLLPLAVLAGDRRWLYRFTLGATAYMLLVYTTLVLVFRITNLLPWPQADWFIIMPAGLPAWMITVGWACDCWRRGPQILFHKINRG